jgi:hypothetical protein
MFSFRKSGKALEEIQAYWQMFVLLFPAAGAAMSIVWAHMLHVPGYQILFYASGVFCFLILGLDRLSVQFRDNIIFGKIRLSGFQITSGKDASRGDIANCVAEMQNMSKCDLFYQIEQADLSMNYMSSQSATVDQVVMLVQAGASNYIDFPSIPGLMPSAMTGKLYVKMKYGRKNDRLDRMMEVVAAPQVAVAFDPSRKLRAVAAHLLFTEVDYS